MKDRIDALRKEIQQLSKEYNENRSVANLDTETLKKTVIEMGKQLETAEGRRSMAGLVTQMIYDTVSLYDLTSIFPKQSFSPSETPVYRKRGRLRVYWTEHGSNAIRTQQTVNEYFPSTRALQGAPSYNYDQFKQGRYGDMAEQNRLINEEFIGKRNKLIFDTITASIPSTTAYGNYAAHAGKMTKTTMDKAIDYVNGANINGVRCIIGLFKHLAPIIDFQDRGTYGIDLWTDEQKRKFMQVGMIDLYRGAPIITLKQYIDGHGLITIPDDEILVIGNDTDSCWWIDQGPFDTLEDLNAVTRDWIINIMIKIGFFIFHPQKNYRIKVSGY